MNVRCRRCNSDKATPAVIFALHMTKEEITKLTTEELVEICQSPLPHDGETVQLTELPHDGITFVCNDCGHIGQLLVF